MHILLKWFTQWTMNQANYYLFASQVGVSIRYTYLLILLNFNLIFFSSINPLLGLQQLYPKILALNLHHICFSFLSNNREYFSKQTFILII